MSVAERPWWATAVVYQLYVRSFSDANGDGIGDLAGIEQRLDYLAELGIDALWMTPCFPSPQHDHGYDVANYLDIEPMYGDLAAFDALVAAAHARGIRILLDIVPNHCSWDHAWFREALAAAPGSPARERFYFRDGRGPDGSQPPNNWMAVFGGPAWNRVVEADGRPGQWYLQTFTPQQPDFNWSNPDVVDHFDHVLRFWFDRQIDGFRVDAVVVLGKAPGLPDAPEVPVGLRATDTSLRNPYSTFRPEGHVVWRHWRTVVDGYSAEHPGRDLFLVAEAYTPRRPDLLLEYVNDEEFHQTFAFDLMLAPWHGPSIKLAIDEPLDALATKDLLPTWTLNNHDAQRAVTRYGRADAHDPASWTGNNLVNSDAPVDVAVGTRRARAMIVLMSALPGSMYLYQGEELGLPEVLDLPDAARQDPIFLRTAGREIGRDGCRVPLPWTADPATNFGFSDGDGAPGAPWLPQPADWGQYASSAEQGDDSSMLALYHAAIRCRREHAPTMAGTLTWVTGLPEGVLAFERSGRLIVLNTTPTTFELPPALTAGRVMALSSVIDHDAADQLPPESALWLVER